MFTVYLHKYVFRYQVRVAVVDLYPALLAIAERGGKEATLYFEEFIDESRQRHWDYAFNNQIRLKQINKLNEWDKAKNFHRNRVVRQLIYRYWMLILLVGCVVLGPHQLFTSWTASGCDLCMYTVEQLTNWKGVHLKSCHWYIEMDSKATLEHKEDTRRSVEPEFVEAPAPTPASEADVEKFGHGSKPRSKEASKDASGGSKRG